MARSALLIGLFLAVGGCTGRPLGDSGGGGSGSAGSGGHGGGSAGHGGGSVGHGGGGSAGGSGDGCSGRDEASCNADSACRADYCNGCGCGDSFVGCVDAGSGPVACAAKEPCQPCNLGCDGLDEASCIAAESSRGCTPFYCGNLCGGGQSYISCLGPTEGQPQCTSAGGSGGCGDLECRSNIDCPGGELCNAPGGGPSGCVACLSDCSSDDACGANEVCSYVGCCGGYECRTPCTSDAECGDDLVCDGGGHCTPIACAGDGNCPTGFYCGAGGVCGRRSCSQDGDCNGAFCVDGSCSPTLGSCGPLP